MKTPPNSTTKIKLYPNEEQRAVLTKWFNHARFTYNKCVEEYNKKEVKKITLKHFRSHCVNSDSFLLKDKKWIFDTPYEVRDGAMVDFVEAVNYQEENKKNHIKNKNYTDGNFKMKYKTKKDSSNSILIRKKFYNSGIFYTTFWKDKNNVKIDKLIKSREPLPDKLLYDTRLQRTRLGKFYLCVMKRDPVKKSLNNLENTISLDPGVRTFMTGYDMNGNIWEWGVKDINKIFRLARRIDKLQTRIDLSTTCSRLRKSLKTVFHREHLKIKDYIEEMHNKCAKWLCENYKNILIPEFNVSEMILKGKRKLRSETVRKMVTWSHYAFRQCLITKSKLYSNCLVIPVHEGYTTKTCVCGNIHNSLGGNKVYKCNINCGYVADRDYHGSFMILIRHLTLQKIRLIKQS